MVEVIICYYKRELTNLRLLPYAIFGSIAVIVLNNYVNSRFNLLEKLATTEINLVLFEIASERINNFLDSIVSLYIVVFVMFFVVGYPFVNVRNALIETSENSLKELYSLLDIIHEETIIENRKNKKYSNYRYRVNNTNKQNMPGKVIISKKKKLGFGKLLTLYFG